MIISSKNILARLYWFNFVISPDFGPSRTDLCHFMRVILFWLPLKVLGYLFLVFVLSMVAIYLPIQEFGIYFYATLVLLAIAIVYLVIRLGQHKYHDLKPPETVMIVCEYARAIKKRVCPLVEIKED